MLFKSITLAISLLTLPLIVQAEIYKAVDAQGHVTYTNQAPVGQGTSTSSPKGLEKVEIHEGYSDTVQVSQIGSVYYCGSIALPIHSPTSTNFYTSVANNERVWKSEIDRIVKAQFQFNRYSRYHSSANAKDNTTKLTENRCAYEWAQDQRNNAVKEKADLNQKSSAFSSYLQELTIAKQSVCKDEPIFSQSDRYYEERHRAWQNCSYSYQSKMKETENELRTVDQQLLDIHKIEVAN